MTKKNSKLRQERAYNAELIPDIFQEPEKPAAPPESPPAPPRSETPKGLQPANPSDKK